MLIVEIGKLAVALGQQQALDSEGVRQATMAQDLLDTRPDVMQRVFVRLRKQCTFLPVTKEVLDVYADELRLVMDAEHAETKRKAEEAEARDRAEHPEDYLPSAVVFNELMQRAGADAFTIREQQREATRARQPQLRAPQVNECPHCGKPIPFSGADLTALTPEDLRSIADMKVRRATEQVQAMHAAAEAAMPVTPARRRARRKKVA